MGDISIQDTGYIIPTNVGTQASSANMANSGSVITIKNAEFIPQLKRHIMDNPELSSNTPSEVNLGSLENMKFTLRIILNKNNDTDTAKVPILLDLVRTYGYKLMWYSYSNATTEKNNGQLIYRLATNTSFGHQLTTGEKTAFSISTSYYHLHVHFFDIQISQTGSSGIFHVALQGVVLKADQSTGL